MRARFSWVLMRAGCATVVPPAQPHGFVAAKLSVPPELKVCWLEYAKNEFPAGWSLSAPSDRDRWRMTVSGLLVRHPKGLLLIDVGNSSHFDQELGDSGFFAKMF